jgi:hypothetical protein
VSQKGVLPHLCEALHALLLKQHMCQEPDSDYEVDDEDEGAADNDPMMDSVTECATVVAKCYGASFAYFPEFLSALMQYAAPHRPPLDRAMGIGAIAELVRDHDDAAAADADDDVDWDDEDDEDEDDEDEDNDDDHDEDD